MNASHLNQTLPPFDELVDLAKHNPDAFVQFKKEMCEEMILSASSEMQDRLWAQQSHIDRVVDRCKNPTHANVLLMKELSQQMHRFQDVLDGNVPKQENSAQIIPFRPKEEQWR
ncbi:DUF3135 domain-containing protein [Vibrio genomosp. F10]|uniref:DUF3135 domain-containing protein n=1 Tax=Vibrio genomosp. F10 TaxID=723171 RepID=UPI0002F44237|nr:DUF3135 domain-containing protein [Vibrio genomosp. F10]OEF01093.1 hypothetical protein A1QK_01575 [Vibrio genomosp. F10 str. 9ZD137]OEF06206.1 hypothetical protein A1QI_06950 [Vibrio genomosp. F10 str. 9ZB36]